MSYRIDKKVSSADFETETGNTFFIYPNPVSDKLTINNGTSEAYSLTIMDNLGRAMIEKEIFDKTYTLDLSQLNPGIYFAKIFNNQTNIVLDQIKLIKL
jgi:hypothetical protein